MIGLVFIGAEYDESKHPRDEQGRWTNSSGYFYHVTPKQNLPSIVKTGLQKMGAESVSLAGSEESAKWWEGTLGKGESIMLRLPRSAVKRSSIFEQNLNNPDIHTSRSIGAQHLEVWDDEEWRPIRAKVKALAAGDPSRYRLSKFAAEHAAELVDAPKRVRDAIRSEVRKALRNGEGPEGIADRLFEELDMEPFEIQRIAETEYVIARTGARLEEFDAQAGDDLDARKRWVLGIGEEGCAYCQALAGQEVPLGDPFVGPDGEEFDGSPAHPNCKCDAELVEGGVASRAAEYDESQHPRDERGRWTSEALNSISEAQDTLSEVAEGKPFIRLDEPNHVFQSLTPSDRQRFLNDYSHMPEARRERSQMRMMDVDGPLATQLSIEVPAIKDIISKSDSNLVLDIEGEPTLFVKWHDKLVVGDGHHRLAAAKFRGIAQIKTEYVNLTAYLKRHGIPAAKKNDLPGFIGAEYDESLHPRDERGRWTSTDTPEFREWFGESKIVNAEGKPLVVYHSGSFNEAEEIAPNIGEQGMHFGTKGAAEERIGGKPIDDAISSISVEEDENGRWHYSIESEQIDSYDLDENGFDSKEAAQEAAERETSSLDRDYGGEEVPITAAYLRIENPRRVADQGADWSAAVRKAKAEGYDGLIYRNMTEHRGKDSYVVFSPDQIKSVKSKKFSRLSKLITMVGAEYDESKHPRDKEGQWTDAGGDGDTFVASPSDALISLHNKEQATVTADDARKVVELAAQEAAGPIDLTNLTIEGTPIFAGGLNRARDTMPQIPREEQERFLEMLEQKRINVTFESVRPSTLLPTQNEIDAVRVGQKLKEYDAGNKDLRAIMVSKDHYVLDGHHRWATVTIVDLESPHAKVKMPTIKLGVDHAEALRLMLRFTKIRGIANRALLAFVGVEATPLPWDEGE